MYNESINFLKEDFHMKKLFAIALTLVLTFGGIAALRVNAAAQEAYSLEADMQVVVELIPNDAAAPDVHGFVAPEPHILFFSPNSVSIPDGTTLRVDVRIPSDIPLVWSSRNRNIATVSQRGVITARSPGTTTITMATADGWHSANLRVTVLPTIFSTSVPANTVSWLMFFLGFGWIWMWFI